MEKYDLAVNKENILKTYKEDLLNRNEQLFAFVELLLSIKKDYSIALDGAWGSGKTFFVKQLEMIIQSTNSNIKSEYPDQNLEIQNTIPTEIRSVLETTQLVPIYYDAWKNDDDDDPVLSLLYHIINTLYTYNTLKKSEVNINELGKEIIQKFIPLDLGKIIETSDILKEIVSKKDAEKQIKTFLDAILPERGNKLIIFIDELDRCKPNYAVKMLEKIKHYFVNDTIIFVFSVNILELQHTISSVYGNDFDGGRYLDRFFDFRVSLPLLDTKKYLGNKFGEGWIFNIVSIITDELNLQMRELCKYQIYIEFLNEKKKNLDYSFGNNHTMIFIYYALLPLAYAYKVININLYNQFIDGNSPELLVDIFVKSNDLKDFCEDILLEKSETFSRKDTSKTLVDLENRITEIYQYICKASTRKYVVKTIGGMQISNDHIEHFKDMLTKFK